MKSATVVLSFPAEHDGKYAQCSKVLEVTCQSPDSVVPINTSVRLTCLLA